VYVLSFYAVWNKKYTDRIINVQQELVELNREIALASENNKRKVKQGKGGRKVKKSRKSNAAGKGSIAVGSSGESSTSDGKKPANGQGQSVNKEC
jgi:hypothetical protein